MGARWTPEDDARIADLWQSERTTKSALPEFPGRSIESIRKRAAALGLPDKRMPPSTLPEKARAYLKTVPTATAKEVADDVRSCEQRMRDALRGMAKRGEIHVVSHDGPHNAAVYAYGPGENAIKPIKLKNERQLNRWVAKNGLDELSDAQLEKEMDKAYRDTKCAWWPAADQVVTQAFRAMVDRRAA